MGPAADVGRGLFAASGVPFPGLALPGFPAPAAPSLPRNHVLPGPSSAFRGAGPDRNVFPPSPGPPAFCRGFRVPPGLCHFPSGAGLGPGFGADGARGAAGAVPDGGADGAVAGGADGGADGCADGAGDPVSLSRAGFTGGRVSPGS